MDLSMPILAAVGPQINFVALAPFGLLLAAIALLPLILGEWWHKNRNKAIFAFLVGAPIAIYLWSLPKGTEALWHGFEEYVQFIALIFSLYVIAGGIVLTGDLNATPRINLGYLAVGALIANIIGTTGASMLLIRPLLRTNRDRHNKSHLPIFFILIVSNCGGLLTPLGDPPLFMGFLRGVDFWWNLRLAPQWFLVNGYLLALFYVWDYRAYARETPRDRREEERHVHPLGVYGWKLNGFLMLCIVGAVIAKKDMTVFPVSELIMLACAIVSWVFTPQSVRAGNHYSWQPIIEVAVLFAAIFTTMIPVLVTLTQHGKGVHLTNGWEYFWLTGLFSSGLDNAPTYMAMANLAAVSNNCDGLRELSLQRPELLAAVSCGAVFMGANSYIGNGPNFMVKAIADHSGYHMPSFFGYVLMAGAILMPVYLLATLLFFI